MAVRTNLKDIAWMYNAPAKRQDRAEVRVPPTSQIPVLGNMPDEMLPKEKEPMQGLIKDTDTPYIILAKTGGRKDLLRFRENKPPVESQEARGYPRCDWYYLEDNRAEDGEGEAADGSQREPWQFRLPEYMVHQPWNPSGKSPAGVRYGPGERGRPPFATDSVQQQQQQQLHEPVPNHMQRFDKRNKLPELRKQGFGVRQQKNEKADAKARANAGGDNQKPIAVQAKPHSEDQLRRKARRGFQDPNTNDGHSNNTAAMGKLLSMGYAKDWEESHDAYEREKAEAAKAQAEKLRRLQARLQENELKQQSVGQKLTEGGMHCRQQQLVQQQGQLRPWKPTTKAGDLL